MDREETILRYLDGTLSLEEQKEFESEQTEAETAQQLQEYRALLGLEQLIAQQSEGLDEDLSVSVLEMIAACESEESIDKSDSFAVSLGKINPTEPTNHLAKVYTALISMNALLLVLLAVLVTKATPVSSPFTGIDASSTHATIALELPLSLEDAAKMRRVDLQVAYMDSGKNVSRELARFIPVVDVQAVHDSALANSRIYIVLPKEQVKQLQFARLFGNVQLSPIESRLEQRRVTSAIRDPEGRIIRVSQEETPEVLYYRQYDSASIKRLVYQEGSWVAQPQLSIEAF